MARWMIAVVATVGLAGMPSPVPIPVPQGTGDPGYLDRDTYVLINYLIPYTVPPNKALLVTGGSAINFSNPTSWAAMHINTGAVTYFDAGVHRFHPGIAVGPGDVVTMSGDSTGHLYGRLYINK